MPSCRTRSRPAPRASASTSGTNETPRLANGIFEAREVPQRHPEPGWPLVSMRIAAHELELAVVDPPEHAVVGAERRPCLAADGRGHLVGRVGVEARRDLQDAVERRPGFALAVVEPCPLERLLGERGDGRGDGGELVVDGVGPIEQELDDAVRLAGDSKGDGDDRLNLPREDRRAVGKVTLESVAIVRANDAVLADRRRQGRPLAERDAAPGDVKARGKADRLDNEDVVALEQRERSALRAEELRCLLREGVRDLGRGGGAREVRAQLLEGSDVPQ